MELTYENDRIVYYGKDGETLAAVEFPARGDGVVEVTRTFVDESLRGQGAAGELMRALADVLRERGLRARLSCSYAVKWFEKNGCGDVLA